MSNDMSAAHAATAAKRQQAARSIFEQADRILKEPRLHGELRSKLQFCQDMLRNPRPDTDIGNLTRVRESLMREARRGTVA